VTPPPSKLAAPGGIDFWFDFISPYGFFASLRIEELAQRHGRNVQWHPLLIGVTVLKVMGLKPVLETPLKGAYALAEIKRYGRRHGVVLARPVEDPPMNPLPVARMFAWMQQHAPAHAKAFAQQALADYWLRAIDLSHPAALQASAHAAGVPAHTVARAWADPQAAALLRTAVEQAIAAGVFGSPFFRLDGEAFFGVDKLELIEQWLASGGW
jgi:2-hydroxychromene-2-carboxylate isomerase